MKCLTLLTLAIFFAGLSVAQTDFRKGYIINQERDTLFGLVDYREGAKAYKTCVFKKSEEQSTMTYEPNDIRGYGFVNDKVFESREISIDDQTPEVVFLEVLVRGPASLYNFKETYFLERDNNGLHPLLNGKREVYVNGRPVMQNTNQYIGTINMLLYDCIQLRSKIPEAKLNERPLTDLVEEYNRCKGASSISFKAKKPWTKPMIGITGGMNFSQIAFLADLGYEHLAGNFELSKSPTIGVSMDILSPRVTERFSFHADVLYLTSKYHNYTVYNAPSGIKRNYVTIELEQLKVPVGLRYTFPKRPFTPYFNLGVSGTIHLSSDPKWVQEVESSGVVSTDEYKALFVRDRQFGYWAGLGVVKSINRNLSAFFELRYEHSNGITSFVDLPQTLSSKISNLQVFIGIRK